MARRKKKRTDRKKRPAAVAVIALGIVVLFGIRLVQVFEPLFAQHVFQEGIAGPLFDGWHLTGMGVALLTSATYLVLSLTGLVVLVGFLRLKPWAWVLLMAWTGISLTISLVEYFYTHNANYAVMAANMVIAFALNQSEVQGICGIRRENESSL